MCVCWKDTVGLNVHPLQPQIMLQSKPAAHTPPLPTFTYGSELEMLGCQKGGVVMEIGQNDGGGDNREGWECDIEQTQNLPHIGYKTPNSEMETLRWK